MRTLQIPKLIKYTIKKTMRNYFDYWYKRTIKDGLKSMKLIVGLGLTFVFGYEVNLVAGILFFGWVLLESLIEKN